MEESAKFVYLFMNSNSELDVNQTVSVIEPVVKNLKVWLACTYITNMSRLT